MRQLLAIIRARFLWLPLALAIVAAGCKSSSTSGTSDPPTPKDEHAKDGAIGADPVMKVRMAAARSKSSNNLRQIGIALHNYLDENRVLPPAAICDPQGKPLLSWRVAVLPYVDENDLYKQFKLNEPWDSAHNKKLIPMMPMAYFLPVPGQGEMGLTHYRALGSAPSEAGKDSAAFTWLDPRQSGPLRGNGIGYYQDGLSNTIFVVEAAEPVEWTKPEVLLYHPKQPLPKFGKGWYGVTMTLFGDGSVRGISDKVAEATLRALITARAADIPGNDY